MYARMPWVPKMFGMLTKQEATTFFCCVRSVPGIQREGQNDPTVLLRLRLRLVPPVPSVQT